MPNKKKKYSARFPPARIKKIMQKDDEVGKVAAAVPVIISRSLELFVESLIKKTNNLVVSRNARTLTPQHIKQTVLLESEFKFLHELVSTIPDVQSTEEEQPSTYLSQQPHAHEASAARPTPDLPSVVATTNSTASTGNITKPGGKQRGRPRKTKTDEVKPSKAKKQKLAATVEDGDSEETCSGSEEENKELNDQSKRGRKASAGQKSNSSKLAHHPSSHSTNCTTLPNTVLFSPSISTGPNSQTFVNDAFQMLELPISSKVVEAYMTLNGGASANPPLVSSQQVPNVQQNVPVISSNDEALDLSTSGGKNGDMRIRKDVPEGETQNKALCIPRTFYMTNILNANIQTMSQPALNEASQNKPQLQGEAYKLNIPKISVQTGSPLVKSDLISPGISLQGCRPSLSQPLSNYDLSQGQPINQAIRPMVASQAIPYQIQNVAQKSHPTQVIFSHMQGPELNQNLAADAQFFNAGSPVRLLQYPRFMSLVPGASSFAGVKSPPSSSQTGGNAAAAPPAEEQKVVPRCESLSTKDSADDKQS